MSSQTPKLDIQSRKYLREIFAWNFKTAFVGEGIEFRDFQEYNDGDDAKHIDWATSSRAGTTIMRRYEQDKQGNIGVLIDATDTLLDSPEKRAILRELLEILSWAASAYAGWLSWYIASPTGIEYFPALRSYIAPATYLHASDERKYCQDDFPDIWELLRPEMKTSILFILSDRLDYPDGYFDAIAHKHDAIFLHISDRFSDTLEGRWLTSVGVAQRAMTIGLNNQKKKAQYREARQAQKDAFYTKLLSSRIESAYLSSIEMIYPELIELLQRRNHW